jgi:hypothetical protein
MKRNTRRCCQPYGKRERGNIKIELRVLSCLGWVEKGMEGSTDVNNRWIFLFYFSALMLLTDSKCPYDEAEGGGVEGSDTDRLAKLSIPRDTPDYLCKTTPSMEAGYVSFSFLIVYLFRAQPGPSFIYRLLYFSFLLFFKKRKEMCGGGRNEIISSQSARQLQAVGGAVGRSK